MSLSSPSTSTNNETESKRTFGMKSFLMLFILASLLVSGYLINWYLDPCTVIARNMNLSLINSCEKTDIKFNNDTGRLVDIYYGEGMDCPSGCIYSYFQGIYSDGKIYKIEVDSWDGNREIHKEIENKYGEWCASSAGYVNPDSLSLPKYSSRYFSYEDGVIKTHLIYNQLSNKDILENLFNKNLSYQLKKGEPQYCNFNGELSYFSSKGSIFVDLSKLYVSKFPLDTKRKSIDDLLNKCSGEHSCIGEIAAAENDPLMCDKVKDEDSSSYYPYMSHDLCIVTVARKNGESACKYLKGALPSLDFCIQEGKMK